MCDWTMSWCSWIVVSLNTRCNYPTVAGDTSSNCCCKCCVVTSWGTPIDGCSSCGDAAPESVCQSTSDPSQTTATVPQTTPYSSASSSTATTSTNPTLSDETKSSTTTISSEGQLVTPPTTTQNFKSEQLVTLALSEMSSDEIASLGYTVNDMILDCQYAGSTCDPKSDMFIYFIPNIGFRIIGHSTCRVLCLVSFRLFIVASDNLYSSQLSMDGVALQYTA